MVLQYFSQQYCSSRCPHSTPSSSTAAERLLSQDKLWMPACRGSTAKSTPPLAWPFCWASRFEIYLQYILSSNASYLVQLHIISLTGGGFALAEGSRVSGMAKMLGESLAFAGEMHSVLVISMCIIISLFCTAFASNVAICNILIPIFSEMVCWSRRQPSSIFNIYRYTFIH